MQRKAFRLWMGLMVAFLVIGTAAFVFFSVPLDQARDLAQWVLPFSSLSFLTSEFFTRVGQPVRLVGALFVAAGLGLLIMPVKTRGWLESLLGWLSKKSGTTLQP